MILSKFQVQNRYLFDWLVDLMAVVVKNKGVNMMSVNNCARVIAPNVYFVEDMAENFRYLPCVISFCEKVIEQRLLFL